MILPEGTYFTLRALDCSVFVYMPLCTVEWWSFYQVVIGFVIPTVIVLLAPFDIYNTILSLGLKLDSPILKKPLYIVGKHQICGRGHFTC